MIQPRQGIVRRSLPCGCHVRGRGTYISPLESAPCKRHRTAGALAAIVILCSYVVEHGATSPAAIRLAARILTAEGASSKGLKGAPSDYSLKRAAELLE